jgi:C4-dicarboxylate-specific signal transduction histidine kinase
MIDQPGILLCERDSEVLFVVPPFLQRMGNVHVARSIVDALVVVHSFPIHVLVIGSALTAEGGEELLQALRERDPHAQVMVLRERIGEDVPTAFLAEGIGDVLPKPFDVACLPRRIRKLLEVKDELQRRARAQREAEVRMRHADRMALLGTLVATVAHEVANPLSVIVTNANLVTEVLGKGPPSRQDLAMLEEATQDTLASTALIHDYLSRILRFARRDSAAHQEADLASTLKTALIIVRSRARDKNVHLHADDAATAPPVPHHPTAFAQAVVNALSNAIDAVGERGNVWLRVEAKEDCVAVIVDDDGPGFEPETGRRLVDPFITTKETGTGLGTAVIRQVMAEHDGISEWLLRQEGGMRVRLVLPKRPFSVRSSSPPRAG